MPPHQRRRKRLLGRPARQDPAADEGENAQVVAATPTAVTFIMVTIRKNGCTVSTMSEAAKRFIANWESEKHRKTPAVKHNTR
jgi:hypothetical protein